MAKTVRLPQTTDELSVGDSIEHSITLEVDTGSGKAWIKYGVSSAMKASESPIEAFNRVATHVDNRLVDLIDEKS